MKTDQTDSNAHVGVRLLSVLLLLFICKTVLATPQFGPIKGTTTIGSPISLYLALSGLSHEQLTQLQTGCMEAILQPSDVSDLSGVSKTQKLIISFDRTMRSGGVLNMTSFQPVTEPVMQVTLSSFCPTVLFTKHWNVLLNPSSDNVALKSNFQKQDEDQLKKQFDLSNSALLKASRRAPVIPKSAPVPPNTAMPVAGGKLAEAAPTVNDIPPPKVFDDKNTSANAPQTVNADPNNHLIRSTTLPASVAPIKPVGPESKGWRDTLQTIPLWWLPLAGFLILCTSSLGIYWYRRKNRRFVALAKPLEPRFGSSSQARNSPGEMEMAQEAESPGSDVSSQVLPTHLFQSLMGVSSNELAVEFDFSDERPRYDGQVSSTDPADLAMASFNKDNLSKWNLPSSYATIVENRNLALQAKEGADFKYFKLALGLIELCLQSILQNRAIDSNAIERIQTQTRITSVDLDQFQGLYTDETVPDLIKSYINEKMLELSDTIQRETMLEQLKQLRELCADLPLCFRSSAWQEYLFQVSQEASIS